MPSRKRREFWNMLTAAAAITALYTLFDILGIGCPIKFITGISCLGCGMTRAWKSVLHFDLKSAFYFHPAFCLPPIAVLLFYLNYKKNMKYYKFFMFTIMASFVIIYIIRFVWLDNDIVVFHPEDNILSRIIREFVR